MTLTEVSSSFVGNSEMINEILMNLNPPTTSDAATNFSHWIYLTQVSFRDYLNANRWQKSLPITFSLHDYSDCTLVCTYSGTPFERPP